MDFVPAMLSFGQGQPQRDGSIISGFAFADALLAAASSIARFSSSLKTGGMVNAAVFMTHAFRAYQQTALLLVVSRAFHGRLGRVLLRLFCKTCV